MAFADLAPLLVGLLFMWLVMPVICIEQVGEFPNLILHMRSLYQALIQVMRMRRLLAGMVKRMLDLLFEAAMLLWPRTIGVSVFHGCGL
jgi:hypothetical protein